MTPIADMVRKMLEKGVAHEAIVMAIEGAELAVLVTAERDSPRDDRDEHRREVDRLRKQRWRDRHVTSRDNRDVSRDTENAPLSKERKKEEVKKERGEAAASVRGHRLPVDWRPTSQDWATSCAMLGDAKAAGELEKFIDHWKQQPGAKGVKLDWAAAWRNWIRRAGEFRGNRNGKATDQLGGFSGLAAQLRRKIAEDEADNDASGFGPAY